MDPAVRTTKRFTKSISENLGDLDYLLWSGRVESFLKRLPAEPVFDLVVTSPPYNLRKPSAKIGCITVRGARCEIGVTGNLILGRL